MLSPMHFAVVVSVSELAREGLYNEILYAGEFTKDM